jgi:hypothetical protein
VTHDAPHPEPAPRPRRFWLTVGEVVAVAGLALAALNYWDNRHDRAQAEREQAQARPRAKVPAFVMRGGVDEHGERVLLEPVDQGQVIQSQRYLFPSAVLDHAKEIGAGRPQVALAWFDDGLKRELKAARKAGAPLPQGEAALPIGVVTTYVEDGDLRTDRSLYRVGYAASPGLLGAVKLELQGVSLIRRGVTGDLQGAVDAQWRAERPKPPRPLSAGDNPPG